MRRYLGGYVDGSCCWCNQAGHTWRQLGGGASGCGTAGASWWCDYGSLSASTEPYILLPSGMPNNQCAARPVWTKDASTTGEQAGRGDCVSEAIAFA